MIKKSRTQREKLFQELVWKKNVFENESFDVFTDCLMREYKVNLKELITQICPNDETLKLEREKLSPGKYDLSNMSKKTLQSNSVTGCGIK